MHDSTIWLQGVHTHNLNNLDLKIPLGKLVAVSGVSGSGKSSLVFHTLHAEAYRRYIDSLSSFARQYLKTMPKPPLKAAHNLPPSIAVQQNTSGYSNRSTVGSFTEIADLLRTIFTHECTTACVRGHGPLKIHTKASIVELILAQHPEQRIMILAPLSALLASPPESNSNQPTRQTKHAAAARAGALLAMLQEQGLLRLERADLSVVKLSELGELNAAELAELPQCAVVMDRFTVTTARADRLGEAVARSLEVSRGMVRIRSLTSPAEARVYKTSLSCSQCDDEAPKPELKYFSYTHPRGACPVCKGYGQANVWAWPKILAGAQTIPDLKLWTYNSVRRYRERLLASMAEHLDLTKPLTDFSTAELALLKWGHGGADVVADPGTLSSSGASATPYLGLAGLLNRLNQAKSLSMRMMLARYKTYVRCHHCGGTRLHPWIHRYTMKHDSSEVTFTDLLAMPVAELRNWLATYFQDEKPSAPARASYTELDQKLGYLETIGLSYLTMDRPTRSLSGGEIQRLRMTKCLGLNLCQTLYCLDEPTAGLHPLDTQKLLKVMHLLKDQGNTVVVVEHDPSVLAASDYLIEVGPLAGAAGGKICFAGHPSQSKNLTRSSCLAPLAGAEEFPSTQSQGATTIRLTGANTHNLKDVDITIPLGAITGICGVSGSGKTSLIRHTLYEAVRHSLGQTSAAPEAEYASIVMPPGAIDEALLMSQKPLGRTSRSHIASYLDIWSIIRQRFAATASARRGGWTASDFSLNTGRGRCETCLGLGVIKEDISFLGELDVTCGDCDGKRYKAQLLDVRYQGKSIDDVLRLTVSEASEFFENSGKISHVLAEVTELGLGYLTLGQTTSTFSGGEAQRLKILKLLIAATPATAGPKLLIFDEPTGGLSEDDIPYLWRKFQRLIKLGHTVIIVEHHLRILKSVHWLLEIGPHAASRGGEVVYQGPPGQLPKSNHLASSAIAPFMYPDEFPSGCSPQPFLPTNVDSGWN